MRAVFKRLERDADLPPALAPTVEELAQQLGAIDTDMMAIHSQLRLLREEADLQAQQRTNQNLYVLSILTAALLPATLVTGFFGMNTGGLPFAHTGLGTVLAGVLAIGSSLCRLSAAADDGAAQELTRRRIPSSQVRGMAIRCGLRTKGRH